MHLSSLCNKNSHTDRYVKEIADSEKPILVFGAGDEGIKTVEFLEEHGVSVEAFCETAPYCYPGKTVKGKPVYDYESLSENKKKCTLVFAASSGAVPDIIKNQKISEKVYFNIFCPPFFEITPEWIDCHIDALDETYHLLEDEASRMVFLSYLETRAHCLNIAVPLLGKLCVPGEYFNDLYNPAQHDCNTLVDCGAYTGDTAEKYLRFVHSYGRKGKVFSFEPDEKNFRILEATAKRLRDAGLGEIQCFPYATGEKKGYTYFLPGLESWSHCVNEMKCSLKNGGGVVKVQVAALDDILGDTPVSMLKMDIEGSELSALKGAQRLIAEQLPFLAICVYHRREDLIQIPQYIQVLSKFARKSYKFYLRHHYTTFNETILYAVP